MLAARALQIWLGAGQQEQLQCEMDQDSIQHQLKVDTVAMLCYAPLSKVSDHELTRIATFYKMLDSQ